MSTQPEVGTIVLAETLTTTAQRVAVEVTAVEQVGDQGWRVWGYRQYRPMGRASHRQTSYPRAYWVSA